MVPSAPASIPDGPGGADRSDGVIRIRRLRAVDETQLHALAELLVDCVDGGATVTFLRPLAVDKALAFWRDVAAEVEHGGRALLVAEDATGIVATVQLLLAQPENQPARADLVKMLVHRRARRQGIALAVMRAAEEIALDSGKSLLVLETPDDGAGRLYLRLGWTQAGTIPGYALTAHGEVCATTFFYKALTRS